MPQIKFLNVNVVISLLEPALEMATVLLQHPQVSEGNSCDSNSRFSDHFLVPSRVTEEPVYKETTEDNFDC